MLRVPILTLPQHPLGPMTWVAYILLGISLLIFIFFWIWALVHAAKTPRAPWVQRLLWSLCLLFNPSATIWYWCIWKRWAFWALFTPLLGMFVALPFVTRSLMSKADATGTTNALFALGSNRLVLICAILLIYPIILRLSVILHLAKNTESTAMERNDWVLILALPTVGFGSAMTYAAKYMKTWALVSLAWLIAFSIAGKVMIFNITPALLPAGDEKREEYKLQQSETIRQRP
jgi:hypothetical protein